MNTTTQYKFCPCCKKRLPVTEFHKSRAQSGGLQAYCKECLKEKRLATTARRLAGTPRELPSEKHCPLCKKMVPLAGWDRNRRAFDGLQSYCKPCHDDVCHKNYLKRKTEDPEWYKRFLEAGNVRTLKRKLKQNGLDVPTYELLVSRRCAICGGPPTGSGRGSYMFDHNHKTGKFRGLLCSQCNTGIGLFRDNPELLMKAIAYLKNNHEVANG